ncbi:putative protein phosphatase 2C 27 [Canna indica]|uniref:protein-serine/threonine phosphatase n=1 Tax=Canna indica TaxID=4628 RepID=A0AAQ3L5D7_9LILI|nr:putative protein phosphatase 2C 27 [Canna indica]
MAAMTDLAPPLGIADGLRAGEKNGGSSSDAEVLEGSMPLRAARPPLPAIRHCASVGRLDIAAEPELDIGNRISFNPPPNRCSGFLPVLRSGSCTNIGLRPSMEDEHICIDNLADHVGEVPNFQFPGAFYGVFDGHGGTDAASFVRTNILKFIVEDDYFPCRMDEAIRSAFLRADYAFADTCSLDITSGTTALAALIFGRTLFIANAGDCRAVLGKRGHAVDLSMDHKPNCISERDRIEKLGGFVYDGYLNGQLSVARAIGDWHMKGSKGSACPLSAEPDLREASLTNEDEFLIMGCDGLWDVMSSQCAVTIVRKELMVHNDPERCSQELVREALKRDSRDNLTVVVVCFSPDAPPKISIPKYKVRKRSISVEGLSFLNGFLANNP